MPGGISEFDNPRSRVYDPRPKERAVKMHLNPERRFSFSSYFYYPSYRREARAPGEGQTA